MKGLLLVLIALALTGCDRLPTAANKARAAVKQLLNDPYSAKFEDVHDSPDGKTVCGFVNAKNAMSAYVGLTRFMFDKGKRQAVIVTPPQDNDFRLMWLQIQGAGGGDTDYYVQIGLRCDAVVAWNSACGGSEPALVNELCKYVDSAPAMYGMLQSKFGRD